MKKLQMFSYRTKKRFSHYFTADMSYNNVSAASSAELFDLFGYHVKFTGGGDASTSLFFLPTCLGSFSQEVFSQIEILEHADTQVIEDQKIIRHYLDTGSLKNGKPVEFELTVAFKSTLMFQQPVFTLGDHRHSNGRTLTRWVRNVRLREQS